MIKRIRFATILFIMITLISPSILSTAQHPGGGDEDTKTETLTFQGDTDEGSSWENTEELGEINLISIVFILTWEDEESDSQPDTFSLTTDDGSHEPVNGEDSSGSITIPWDQPDLNTTWNMMVTCENAGDQYGPGGLLVINEDSGNKWTLTVTYEYTEGSMMGGGPPPGVLAVLESPVFKLHIALMIASVFLFLITGLVAGAYLFTRLEWKSPKGFSSFMHRLFNPPVLLIFLVILTFIVFFIAAVPIGMWVAGNFYGWHKAWTGFPAIWNPEAFDMTNADNVSFIVLLLWFIPMYINRAQVFGSKYFKRLFGRFKFIMNRAEKAPPPRISNGILALCYFFMGIFTYVVFMVQPHGGGS